MKNGEEPDTHPCCFDIANGSQYIEYTVYRDKDKIYGTTFQLLIKLYPSGQAHETTLVLTSVDCPSLLSELFCSSGVLKAVLSFLAATFAKLREARTVGVKVGPEV